MIHVRSSFEDVEGTRVKEVDTMESSRAVTGVTMSENEAIVSVIKVPDSPGNAGKLFTELGKAGVNVDMILQSLEQGDDNSISFSGLILSTGSIRKELDVIKELSEGKIVNL